MAASARFEKPSCQFAAGHLRLDSKLLYSVSRFVEGIACVLSDEVPALPVGLAIHLWSPYLRWEEGVEGIQLVLRNQECVFQCLWSLGTINRQGSHEWLLSKSVVFSI